jgi:hypothetical protein
MHCLFSATQTSPICRRTLPLLPAEAACSKLPQPVVPRSSVEFGICDKFTVRAGQNSICQRQAPQASGSAASSRVLQLCCIMPPRRLEEQHSLEAAVDAARRLSSLLQDPEVSQQLQQAPAAPSTQQQQATKLTLGGTWILVHLNNMLRLQLHAPAPSTSAAATGADTAALEPARLVSSLLRHKAACAVGTILAWTLQRPEHLQLTEMLTSAFKADEGLTPPTAADLWVQSSACVTLMGSSLVAERMSRHATCREETLAAAMLQQLEQSGK